MELTCSISIYRTKKGTTRVVVYEGTKMIDVDEAPCADDEHTGTALALIYAILATDEKEIDNDKA